MSAPYYGKQPEDGLHILKNTWRQKQYLRQQSECLAGCLAKAIKTTYDAAPVRTQGYALDRGETLEIDATERERLWERSIFRRWSQVGLSPVGNSWDRLIAFQVPLFDCQEKAHWGYIDLLGICFNGVPSVVELKREPATSPAGITMSSETPLRMVLEAGAYAVALRRNWETFRREFIPRLKHLQLPDATIDRVPSSLEEVRLVCVAPASFWIDWLPVTEKGKQVSADAWKEFSTLLRAFEKALLPVSFVSISGDACIPGSLAAQPLSNFPGLQP